MALNLDVRQINRSANEQTDYLMVINQRRPWTLATEELRGRGITPFEPTHLLKNFVTGSKIVIYIGRTGVQDFGVFMVVSTVDPGSQEL
ncbi:unnamed protein product [Spodoptera exigua]|nr:unnamed protein product [Spodoptera exigua]